MALPSSSASQAGRQRGLAVQRAEQGPAQGPGGRGRAAVVHREPQPVPHVLADQGAVHGDGQHLLGGVRVTQRLDEGRARDPLAYGAEGLLERLGDLVMAGALGEQREGVLHGAVQGLAAGQAVHHDGEGARGEQGGGVTVGLGGAFDGQLEDELRLPPDQQPERGGPGEGRRVACGGVLGPVEGAHRGVAEPGEAFPGGGAAGVQPLLLGEPAVLLAAFVGPPLVLGGGPAQMGTVHIGGRVPGTDVAADLGADQPVDGEQVELGDRGDRAASAVDGDEVGDGVGAVGRADLFERETGDGRTERVADGTAQQTATYPAAEVLLFDTAPDSCGSCAHRAPSPSSYGCAASTPQHCNRTGNGRSRTGSVCTE